MLKHNAYTPAPCVSLHPGTEPWPPVVWCGSPPSWGPWQLGVVSAQSNCGLERWSSSPGGSWGGAGPTPNWGITVRNTWWLVWDRYDLDHFLTPSLPQSSVLLQPCLSSSLVWGQGASSSKVQCSPGSRQENIYSSGDIIKVDFLAQSKLYFWQFCARNCTKKDSENHIKGVKICTQKNTHLNWFKKNLV